MQDFNQRLLQSWDLEPILDPPDEPDRTDFDTDVF